MILTPFVEAVTRDLAGVAGAAGPEAAEVLGRVSAALESSIRLRMLEALSLAAHELSSQGMGGRVEVRLEGPDPVFRFVEDPPATAAGVAADGAPAARITLRMPAKLKTSVERAAVEEGVSANTWINQALSRAIGREPRRFGARLTGFARS